MSMTWVYPKNVLVNNGITRQNATPFTQFKTNYIQALLYSNWKYCFRKNRLF